MCQQYQNEADSIFRSERQERREKIQKHESGECVLTDEEIQELVVQEIMARDAGY